MSDIAIVIDEISKKLGVAASEIYSVLQYQAKVCAIKNSVWLIVYAALIILFFVYLKKVFVDKTHTNRSGEKITRFTYYDLEDDDISFALIVLTFIFAIIAAACVVMFFITLDETITCVLNPKFWALDQILS